MMSIQFFVDYRKIWKINDFKKLKTEIMKSAIYSLLEKQVILLLVRIDRTVEKSGR